ncbi:MAG: hypothetical protein ABL964_10055 [Steroidobacteraceae bacterium]
MNPRSKEGISDRQYYPEGPDDAFNPDGSMRAWHDYFRNWGKPQWQGLSKGAAGERTGGGRRGGYSGRTLSISCPVDDAAWIKRLGAGNARRGIRAMVALGRGMDAAELRAAVLAVDPDAFGMEAAESGQVYPPVMDGGG